MPPARLHIRLLGPVDMRFDGGTLVVDTRKAIALLAYLAVTGRAASRATLAALLWPDADDEGARGALRRTLSVLNKATGSAALRIDRGSVALGEAAATSDVVAFRDELARVRRHQHADPQSCAACLGSLSRAAALDRGEFMEGFALRDSEAFDDWQRSEAERHRLDLGAILERLGHAHAGAGRWDEAVRAGRRWLELDPLHEPASRLLMMIHARSGETSAAIQQYRDCVAVLDRELGVAPLAETTALYEAIREGRLEPLQRVPTRSPDVSPEPPAIDPDALPLVGRDGALERALAVYHEAADGGRIVAIPGEAGIGKTRLAEAIVAATTEAGARVLNAAAQPGEEGIAYGLILGLLRTGLEGPGAARALAALPAPVLAELDRLMPGIIGAIPMEHPRTGARDTLAAHLAVLDAIALAVDSLVAGPAPGVMWLDSLEWADASSLEVLAYFVRRLERRKVLVVAAWRPEDVDAHAASFVELVVDSPATTVLSLDRLDRRDVGRIVAASGFDVSADRDFVDALFDESEGLPLYIVEALASHRQGQRVLPSGIRALLRERIGSLGETARQLISTAAVIGRWFNFATVRQASGRSEDEAVEALEELVRRGLIRERGPEGADVQYGFSHAAFRDAAYESTSLVRRRLLHGRVAEALRSVPARSSADQLERLALIAVHERAAGRNDVAADAFLEAARLARRLSAPRDAVSHLESALALGHPDVAAIQLLIGQVRVLLGDYAPGIQALETAAALSSAADRAAVELELARAHGRRGDLGSAASHLDAAVDLVAFVPRSTQSERIGTWALIERGLVALRTGDLEAATASATEGMKRAGQVGDDALAVAHRVLGLIAIRRNDIDGARRSLGRSLELSGRGDDPDATIATRNALALAEAAGGDHGAAAELLVSAVEDCRRIGSRHLEAALENNLADVLHAAGRADESMAHLKRAVELFADVGGMPDVLDPEIWRLAVW